MKSSGGQNIPSLPTTFLTWSVLASKITNVLNKLFNHQPRFAATPEHLTELKIEEVVQQERIAQIAPEEKEDWFHNLEMDRKTLIDQNHSQTVKLDSVTFSLEKNLARFLFHSRDYEKVIGDGATNSLVNSRIPVVAVP